MESEPRKGLRQYLEMVTGPLEDKKRYRDFKARAERLPDDYRAAVNALQRYMQYFGPTEAEGLLKMLEDLVDLFEQSVAAGTPLRDVVGEDPVEFAELFLRNYPGAGWVGKERERLAETIDRAIGERS
ncbi:MAG: DUF1048 domain-containing protein [Nonomuraea sp.]|nr:DUF1048 domain-containing protein [Nonomuraea sp.]